ncbi:DUF4352 domain-containing protein [Mycobacterium sp.]|uniref:DUF4352 domain-containing protein n=1 Tax=Mycobacterium sp. TaxID=1785 RepID=UPI003D6C32CF
MKPLVAVPLSSLAVVLAACSGNNTGANQPPSTSAQGSSSAQSSSPTTQPVTHVGGTLDLTGEQGVAMGVTLTQIINPANGAVGPPRDNNGNPNGSYVAVMVTIKNTGNSALEDDANNDAALVGSNNQTYTPALGAVTECTNFDNGVYRLQPGESSTGCIAFVMPSGVSPSKFKYAPASGFANDFGEWLIP